MSQRIKITFAYDGTAYHGLQVQPGFPTVQAELERVLEEIGGEPVRLHCCGRTDTGVHARAMTAHFDWSKPMEPKRLRVALNALLPEDIRVAKAERVAPDFHARFSAVAKEYRYFIRNGNVMPPFKRFYALHERRPLDVARMRRAAAYLVGEHDFRSFCAAAPGQGGRHGTVRIIHRLEIRKQGNDITVCVEGNGFLYKMVRTLVGFLMRVGRGELEPGSAQDFLSARERTADIPSARAHGLFMWKVWYEERGVDSGGGKR